MASEALWNSALAIERYLKSERGLQLAGKILPLFDDSRLAQEQRDLISDFLERHRDTSGLLISYVGHDGFTEREEYLLALRQTQPWGESGSGLTSQNLADSLGDAFGGKRISLILDCCFAGAAAETFQSDIGELVTETTYFAFPKKGTADSSQRLGINWLLTGKVPPQPCLMKVFCMSSIRVLKAKGNILA